MMRQARPDAVLLDILMQGRDGFDVLREMKDDPDLVDIPVIMISGAGQAYVEQIGLSTFAVARKDRLTIEQVTAILRAVLSSMSPDYLSYGTTAPGRPRVPAG